MTRLLLVRHGESEWNAVGRWQGQADPPLSPEGERSALEAAKALHGFDGAVVSSDLRRAMHTAEIISEALGLGSPVAEPRLRERDVGLWTGLTRTEIQDRFPDVAEAWREGRLVEPAGGELLEAFRERVLAALRALARLHAGRDVLVVTHGGAIHTLERHLDVWTGAGIPNLAGRWFEMSSELRVAGERLELIVPLPVSPRNTTIR